MLLWPHNNNSGNSLLPPPLSLEELGRWKTFFTPPGTDLLFLLQYKRPRNSSRVGTVVFQGLDQLSLDGVEGTQEKRRKIVTYVMSNLRRWTILNIVFNNLWHFSCLQSQHICLQVHSLWAAKPGEHFWANVAHGCLLWGTVHIIRPGGRLYAINMLQTEILFEVVRLTGQNIEERVDPMARVFPKMTKCTFHK